MQNQNRIGTQIENVGKKKKNIFFEEIVSKKRFLTLILLKCLRIGGKMNKRGIFNFKPLKNEV